MKGKVKKLILALIMLLTSLSLNVFAEQEGRNLRSVFQGINLITEGKLINASGQEYTGGNITADEKFTALFKWSISDDISPEIVAGDYFEFELPENIKMSGALSGLLNPGFGTYTVVDKVVRLTFSEKISKGFTNNGELVLGLEIDPTSIIEPGPIEIKVPYSENSPYEFMLKPRESFNMIDKSGIPNKEKNPEFITWDIVFNKNYDKLGQVKISEIMPEGLSIKSIEIYDVILDLDGNIVNDSNLSDVAVTIDGQNIIFANDVSRPYRIKIQSTIDELPDVGNVDNYLNVVKLESEEFGGIAASATVAIESGNILEKQGTSYDADNRTVSWTVMFNGNMAQLTNPILTDRMDNKLEIIKESLKVVGVESEKVYSFDVQEFTGGFDLTILDNLSEEVKITYTTKLKEGATLDADQSFNNEIMFGEVKVSSNYGITQALFWKGNEGINYTDQHVVWTWDINRAKEQMNNAVITDVFNSGGLEYVEGSFEMYERSGEKRKLIENIDYTLTSSDSGLVVELIGSYAVYSESLVAQYRTTYDVHKNGNVESTLRNTATLEYVNAIGTPTRISDYETVVVNANTGKNGFKSGSYNAVEKSITWSMALNYNRIPYLESILKDVIQDGQKYSENSLYIYPYTISSNGEIVVDRENPIDLSTIDVTLPTEENNNSLEINFSNMIAGETHFVEFKTIVVDNFVKENYKNTAEYRVDDKLFSLDASVEIKYGKELVGKDGVQNKDKFEWGVYINRSQSVLDNVVVKDTPSKNQMIDTESFKIYGTSIDPTGTISENKEEMLSEGIDYTITFTESSLESNFEIKFNHRISSAIYIYYETFSLVTIDNREISNDISVKADGIEFEDMIDEGSKTFQAIYTAGTGSSVIGSYSIKKIDGHGNPLAGVKFSLTYLSNENFKYEGITDQDGILKFTPLRMGDYRLIEEKSLNRFTIPKELQEGIQVSVDQETSTDTFNHVIKNESFKVVLEKVDENGNLLNGAVFTLQKFVDDQYVDIRKNILVEGSILLDQIEPGSYRIIEVKPNQGYALNEDVLDFTVSGDEITDLHLQFTNYQGSVVLTKRDIHSTPLENIQFDLYLEDQLLKSSLTTDEYGKIYVSSLEPGNYKFYETKADGYIANTNPIEFIIDETSNGPLNVIEVNSVNQKGSVILRKVNDNGDPLANVVFDLSIENNGGYDPVGLYISDSNGEIVFDELIPGTYQIIETLNPNHYIVDKKPINFVIHDNQSYDLLGSTIHRIDLGSFVNSRGTLRIEKVDPEGNLIDGAVFEVRDEDGNVVIENIELKNGSSRIENLKPGLYTLIEVKAPQGYVLSNKPIEFEIASEMSGELVEQTIQVVNHKAINPSSDESLPNTGKNKPIHNVIALGLVAVGLVILLRTKRSMKKNEKLAK